ncbi:hypothetical protein [Pseudomonas viridiflava]|uniref:hypothetical protein n=1 Tax=Pseudomonas viridiflava TaxID=33069 RepID=UPI0013C3313D|nr:hypothetical protein [Pseudomonas viridiflava]
MMGWAVMIQEGVVVNKRSVDVTMDLFDGEYFHTENDGPPPDPVLPPSRLMEVFRTAIQKHLDAAAVVVGYDDIKTAVTYAEEPAVPKFQAEGQALRAWRSRVWDYCFAQIAAVHTGERELPSADMLIAELPALVMP